MDFSIYLAFLPAQWNILQTFRDKAAWLGCRLSSYGEGITGLPPTLPEGSMLILTDETPPQGHDPQRIATELTEHATRLGADKILLDFQREGLEENCQIAETVLKQAAIPVGITEQYAKHFDCPVLLSPPPLWTPLEKKAGLWSGRELWLEAVTESAVVTVTQEGSRYETTEQDFPETSQLYEGLCLRYAVEWKDKEMLFYLKRDKEMAFLLLEKAKKLGFTTGVGLYGELGGPSRTPGPTQQ